MFRCAEDGHVTRTGEMRIPVVTEVRPVLYVKKRTLKDEKTGEWEDVTFASHPGTETVQEKGFCPKHAALARQNGPITVEEDPKTVRITFQ